jgi:hypothetical protein
VQADPTDVAGVLLAVGTAVRPAPCSTFGFFFGLILLSLAGTPLAAGFMGKVLGSLWFGVYPSPLNLVRIAMRSLG